jgi:hypothetical protein
LTLTASLVIVGALCYRRAGFDRSVAMVVVLAAIVPTQVISSRSFEQLRLRLTTESLEDWYRATIDAPLALSLETGAITAVPITITNSGRTTWDPGGTHPFRLAYHWLEAQDDRVAVWEGARTDFPAPVGPGDVVAMKARIEAPAAPGSYRLIWDVEQADRLWFSSEPGALLTETRATVSGSVRGAISPPKVVRFPRAAVRPGRLILWRAAGRMLVDRPLLGVGPDNFRLLYGRYAGIANADPREHSNNMYLEMFAGSGLIGGGAFIWLAWRALGRFAAAAFGSFATGAGIAAAGAAIGIHGLADAFLGFTATYTLIAITAGLAVGSTTMNHDHAHRI